MVHRCEAGGSMPTLHAAGPILGRDKLLGEVFFGVFPHL